MGESFDSMVTESERGLNTGRMPQTSTFLLDNDYGASGGNGTIWSESAESDGVGIWTALPRSREHELLKPRRKERYRECGEEVWLAGIRLVRIRRIKREEEKKKERVAIFVEECVREQCLTEA